MKTIKENKAWTTPRKAEMVWIGKRVPRELTDKGWKEVRAMHFGNNLWAFRLEADHGDLKA